MVNGVGLKGGVSSSNSALIIPKPGSSTIFYIFTAAAIEANNEGYFYSEVDMSLQGGLGAVTSNKNILLYSPSTEKLTAVRHGNGIDVWVITRPLGSGEWKVFKVDCNGVNTTPVVSSTGYVGAVDGFSTAGCLKSSPDGTKIAAVNSFAENWELLEFDASTGKLFNNLVFPESPIPYGVEFSPDSKFIYIGEFFLFVDVPLGGVFQFNLSSYDSVSIAASRKLIGMSASNFDFMGALQLGPDKKIYCALANASFLSVINAPDLQGMACGFSDRQVQLGNNTESGIGLPPFFLTSDKNVDFNYARSSDCATVNFSGNTNITGNVNWLWDFGDGTTGAGQNISHTYTSGTAETDTVTLTVTPFGTCGSLAVSKKISFDFRRPIAAFGYKTKCESFEVSFFDSSSGSVPIQNWSWDFGDGNTSSQQNPSHIFNAYGSYTVKLTVETVGGCNRFATIQKNIILESKPVADFTNTSTCIGKPVSFTDNSSTAFGNITAWYWDFGDGTSSVLQNPQKTFTTAGAYEVRLVVVSSSVCVSDTAKRNIIIGAAPTAGINATSGCINKIISIQDASAITGDNITRWYWSLGNGNTSVEQNPAIIYSAPGSFSIKHVVESGGGCISDTAIATVSIESIPIAGIKVMDGCEGQAVQFFDSSSIDFGAITKWNWEFGDGNISIQQNPSFTYAIPNNYTVKLSVASANGCVSDTVSKTILIGGMPVVEFTNTEACIGKQIQFTNNTSLSFGTISGYEWNFGEGPVSAEVDPVHTYNHAGDFVATLKAVTANGCEATASKTFHIAPVNAFAGNDTTVATGQPVQLHASGGKFYQWSPPDFLNSDNVFNPVATLGNDQGYRVKVITEEGCIAFDDILIHVLKGPDIYVPSAFAPNGKNKIFRPILAGIQELYFFSVYNRWGQLVFTTREPGKGWDGRINGVDQPTGVFVWTLKAKDYQGRVISKNGTVTLIR